MVYAIVPELLVEWIDAPESFFLFVGDNVDHNMLTVDGKGTFHRIGMIAAVIPVRITTHDVRRQSIADLNIAEMCKMDILEYRFTNSALKT